MDRTTIPSWEESLRTKEAAGHWMGEEAVEEGLLKAVRELE